MTDAQYTLVAWLGPKPGELAALLEDLRQGLARELGDLFEPYLPEQTHATVIGLERVPGSRNDNANLLHHTGKRVAMDATGFLESLAADERFPVSVGFGGFAPQAVPFRSRGCPPWERGFSIQGDKAVLIGWPAGSPADPYPDSVDALRRRAEAFGIRHAYHRFPGDVDNDLYLRLGHVGDVEPARRARVERRLRDRLATRQVLVPLGVRDLRVAKYRDPRLLPATTRSLGLTELAGRDPFTALAD